MHWPQHTRAASAPVQRITAAVIKERLCLLLFSEPLDKSAPTNTPTGSSSNHAGMQAKTQQARLVSLAGASKAGQETPPPTQLVQRTA